MTISSTFLLKDYAVSQFWTSLNRWIIVPFPSHPGCAKLLYLNTRIKKKQKLRLWAERVGHWNEDESLWTLTAQVK